MLNTTISTEHLQLSLATLEDLMVLKKIYAEATLCYSFDTGYKITSPEVILRKGALPANHIANNSYIYCIYLKGHMIGYIEVYLSFPTSDNIYIPFFYITDPYKNKDYKEDVLACLIEAFGTENYKTVSVYTALKTWKDLAFWQSCGFDTILSVETDSTNTEHSYGYIELQYII
ncbi:GNAT family N-acetyltransferase [Cellulosilyticum lentocellum]|uniref:GCN5-related N-acetyltransferase n=1 Tax=Cellulosilyticum lentocellum (strain ATCC 49066 / DSM 5427 / NCIMB 11756 / RHM5) TaxID=642492 RepID=F2JM25_CELLD|nr:GNAT family N-acetyltransferase [Cellulosilyticum lentocellum]ADZ85805.1 hypothetical protein Clole_4132 [Cellulosilyticum lentocellum DSM 5427]